MANKEVELNESNIFIEPLSINDDILELDGLRTQYLEGMPRVVTLKQAAQKIGELVVPQEAIDSPTSFGINDEALDAIKPSNIANRLYFPYERKTENGKLKPANPNAPKQAIQVYGGYTLLNFKGTFDRMTGVVFHAHEFKKVASSIGRLVESSGAGVRASNPINDINTDPKNVDRKTGSSYAKTAADRIEAADKLSLSIWDERLTLKKTHKGFRNRPPILYRPENALSLLLKSYGHLRQTLETSGINNPINGSKTKVAPLPPEVRQGSQRALVVELFHNLNWQPYTEVAGLHANARLKKIDESRNAALIYYSRYRENILEDEIADYDRKAIGVPHPMFKQSKS